MIEVKNLTKLYGSKRAVDDISFTVNDGEILGFLGPNGAGKTTTMNIITGYSSSTEGTVTINGTEIFENPIKAKKSIGYLPELPPLYLDMTVREYLDFMYDLKKLKLPKQKHIQEVCQLVRIGDVYNRMIKNLSKGYRQRVGLAQALLGNPDVLILDEPTVGLDPKQIIDIRRLIKELGEKHTIILSSHILPEIQATCERVIVINKGKIIADDTPDNLSKSMSSDHRLTVRIDGPEDEVYKLLTRLPDMQKVDKLGMREGSVYDYTLEALPGADVRREMFNRLADCKWPILALRSSEMTLEDIFLQLTSEDNLRSQDLLEDPAVTADDLELDPESSTDAKPKNTPDNTEDEEGGDGE